MNIRCFCGARDVLRPLRCHCEGACACGEARCDRCAGRIEGTPEQAAYEYAYRIRSDRKRDYAKAYIRWRIKGCEGSEPDRGSVSVMAAQGVRLQIDEMMRAGSAAGRAAYEADCRARPLYHDGTPRRRWDQLGEVERWSWERNPTPRWDVVRS